MSQPARAEIAFDRDELRQQKRMAVLRAGARLFSERGYDRTSLDDIARELGVSKRTLYYYVDSKDDILFECTQMAIDALESAMEDSRDRDRSVRKRIETLMHEYARVLSNDFGACLVRCGDDLLSDTSRAVLQDGFKKIDHAFRDLLQQGIDDGSIAPNDTRLTAALIFGAFNWVPHWNRDDKVVPHAEVANHFLDTVLDGLCVR